MCSFHYLNLPLECGHCDTCLDLSLSPANFGIIRIVLVTKLLYAVYNVFIIYYIFHYI